MKRLHISILTLFGWFFVFYNIERLFESVNLASFVYLLAPALGMIVLCVPRLLRVRAYWYIPISLISVVALRSLFGYGLGGYSFSLVVTEGLATWITMWLSYHLAMGIQEYHSAAATAICSHLVDRCRPFEEAHADVIREVRRARENNRPIAVLALSPQSQGEPIVDRFTDEFRTRLMQQYVSARAAEFLSTRLRQYDILTETKDEFLALLPETNREDAIRFAEKIRRDLCEQLGFDLQVGISVFPEDEVTAIGLIERAEAEKTRVAAAGVSTDPAAELASAAGADSVQSRYPHEEWTADHSTEWTAESVAQ
jgi:GGDEF domain-containing protein